MTNNFESKIEVRGKEYNYFSIKKLAKILNKDISKLPFSLKILVKEKSNGW